MYLVYMRVQKEAYVAYLTYCLYIAYVRQCIFYFGITFQDANKSDGAHRLTVLRCTRNNILLDCHKKFF